MPIISIEIINYLHQFQGCLPLLATNPQRNTAQGHLQDVRFISIFYNRWHSIIDFVTKFPEPTPLEPISVNFTHMRLQVEDTKGFDTFHWLWPEKIIGNTFYFFVVSWSLKVAISQNFWKQKLPKISVLQRRKFPQCCSMSYQVRSSQWAVNVALVSRVTST